MDYEESLTAVVTRQEAERELQRHGATFKEFARECGNHTTYAGAVVLRWLGY